MDEQFHISAFVKHIFKIYNKKTTLFSKQWMLDLIIIALSDSGSWWLTVIPFFLSNTFRVKRSPKKSPLSDTSQVCILFLMSVHLSLILCLYFSFSSVWIYHCHLLCFAGPYTCWWSSLPPLTGRPRHRWGEAGLLHQSQVGSPARHGCRFELWPTRLPSAMRPYVLC